MNTLFCELLLKWNKKLNHRPMPWKGEKDPYKIWLSEIILQQTRVEQGWAYYEKFVKKYPNIHKLAAANDKAVLKLWEGLGYYNRCKNLLFTARFISVALDGQFPNNYEALLSLKGVGPYTASAIASFAYNLPHAVVDGNVFRVFARYFGIHTAIDSKEGLQVFNTIAYENLAKKQPGLYNQALMDFGATVCKPLAPLCAKCLMNKTCVAFTENIVGQLPYKSKTIQKKKRYFDYFCLIVNDRWFIQQRPEGDIWAGLYQFYLVENDKSMPPLDAYINDVLTNQLLIHKELIKVEKITTEFKQQLTHQLLSVRFTKIHLNKVPKVLERGEWVKKNTISTFPFPKTIKDFLMQEGH